MRVAELLGITTLCVLTGPLAPATGFDLPLGRKLGVGWGDGYHAPHGSLGTGSGRWCDCADYSILPSTGPVEIFDPLGPGRPADEPELAPPTGDAPQPVPLPPDAATTLLPAPGFAHSVVYVPMRRLPRVEQVDRARIERLPAVTAPVLRRLPPL